MSTDFRSSASELPPTTGAHLPRHLRLLTYNVQMGIRGESLPKAIVGGWKHFVPHPTRFENLSDIADVLSSFDVVALQEVDAGSLRSNYVNLIEYLALEAHFPYWYWQRNRNLGRLAQHCSGFLSRHIPNQIDKHKLPGLIPGRGAMVLQFGNPDHPLLVIAVHLALSRRARDQQLAYIADLIQNQEHVILMGDMNAPCEDLVHQSPLRDTALQPVNEHYNTFPSWRPTRNIDHFFVSPSIHVEALSIIQLGYSDHLPIAIDIKLPEQVCAKAE